MDYPIEDVEGIGPAFAAKLSTAGIKKTGHLLKLCCDKKGRKKIAEGCDIPEKMILKWANLADLMRLNGIGPQFSELLEGAGVDTVKELKMRKADNLTAKMKEVNDVKKLTRAVPTEKQVQGWIDQAKVTEPMITH